MTLTPVLLGGVAESSLEIFTQSWYLMIGVGLLAIAVILSALSGLIDIALYVAVAGGIILVVVAAIHTIAPGLLPILIDPIQPHLTGPALPPESEYFWDSFSLWL